jgi:hypothetical protein
MARPWPWNGVLIGQGAAEPKMIQGAAPAPPPPDTIAGIVRSLLEKQGWITGWVPCRLVMLACAW